MDESSNNNKKTFNRDSIIGLGEGSFKKNYYPELQQKIAKLEQMQARNESLMAAVQDILLVSTVKDTIEPFAAFTGEERPLQRALISNSRVMELLTDSVIKTKTLGTYEINFQIIHNSKPVYLEARFKKTQIDEVLIMIRDMSSIIHMEHTLRDLAERDPLTKMYNRVWFDQRMSLYTGKPRKNLALIMFDVNSLQFINNTLGHTQGDKVITEAAKLLAETFSGVCQIARVGGDEFAGLIENIDVQKIEKLITKFIEANEVYNKTHTGHVLVSVGYSHHAEGIVNTEIMYQDADAKMHQNSQKGYEKAKNMHIQTFLSALEKKRHLTASGSKKVEFLAVQMAKALKMSAKKRENLVLLSRFYDIGMIGISESILNKETMLHDIEWNLIRSHSVIGERIAGEIPDLKHLCPLILKHHERWNGSGYPLGLFKTDIPLECRIIHLIDSFASMTSSRPYRKKMKLDDARFEIKTGSGTRYEPELTEIFLSIIDQHTEFLASS